MKMKVSYELIDSHPPIYVVWLTFPDPPRFPNQTYKIISWPALTNGLGKPQIVKPNRRSHPSEVPRPTPLRGFADSCRSWSAKYRWTWAFTIFIYIFFYIIFIIIFLYILWTFSKIRITNSHLNILALISFFFDSNLQCPIANLCSILDSHNSQILIALIKHLPRFISMTCTSTNTTRCVFKQLSPRKRWEFRRNITIFLVLWQSWR